MTIEDCINNDRVRLVLANPEAACIGKFTKDVLLQNQREKQIKQVETIKQLEKQIKQLEKHKEMKN